jgi:hypothetical protein
VHNMRAALAAANRRSPTLDRLASVVFWGFNELL